MKWQDQSSDVERNSLCESEFVQPCISMFNLRGLMMPSIAILSQPSPSLTSAQTTFHAKLHCNAFRKITCHYNIWVETQSCTYGNIALRAFDYAPVGEL